MPTKWLSFKTFRALGKCRKTGIYGACIRPQGTLQNLSHKILFNDITLQNDLSFLEVWERFLWSFTQRWIRSKCNFMKRDENELVAKYSSYRAKLSTNISYKMAWNIWGWSKISDPARVEIIAKWVVLERVFIRPWSTGNHFLCKQMFEKFLQMKMKDFFANYRNFCNKKTFYVIPRATDGTTDMINRFLFLSFWIL